MGESHPPTLRSPADLIDPDDASWSSSDLGAMWRHTLSLPVSGLMSLPSAGRDDKPIRDIVHGAAPDLSRLRGVKDVVKMLEQGRSALLPKEIGWLLYLVAVAAARCRLHASISTTPDPTLRQWIDWALSQGWLDDDTRGLLQSTRSSIDGAA